MSILRQARHGNTVTEWPVVNGDSLIFDPSHNGMFAVKITGVWAIVIEALCFTPIRVLSPPATFLNFSIASGAIRASSIETKRTFTQSIHAKAEDALLLEILPTKRASITSGLFITRVLAELDALITNNVFVFSTTLSTMAAISHNNWSGGMFCTRRQFQKTLTVLSILSKSGSLQMHWTWICHKAPQRTCRSISS